jgi:hypothetical protein
VIITKVYFAILACKEPRAEWGVSGIEFRDGEFSLRMVCRCRPDELEIAEESD